MEDNFYDVARTWCIGHGALSFPAEEKESTSIQTMLIHNQFNEQRISI